MGTTYPAGYDTVGRVMINGVEHVFTAWTGFTMTLGGAGLNATQANGNPVTVTQFWTDDFTTAAADNAAAVLAAATATPISANIKKINNTAIIGNSSTTPFGV